MGYMRENTVDTLTLLILQLQKKQLAFCHLTSVYLLCKCYTATV